MLGDRALGPVALALFAHGCGQGSFIPFIALWIVGSYHRGGGAIAAYFACAALGGMLLNPLLGRLSDRMGRRRPAAAATALMQGAGLLVLALHPAFWLVLTVAGVLMSAQVQPHLFALVNDHIGEGHVHLPRGVTIAIERSMISGAWAVGAPLGGWLSGESYALLFAVAAACNIAAAVLAWSLCVEARPGASTLLPAGAGHQTSGSTLLVRGAAQATDAARGTGDTAPGIASTGGRAPAPADGVGALSPEVHVGPGPGTTRGAAAAGPARWGQLVLYGLAMALVAAGNASKMQAVPLYLTQLGLKGAVVGATYAWMAALEMLFMPPTGRLADRVARRWVVAWGTLGGALFFAAVALTHGPLAIAAAFPAVSFMVAAVQGVGIGYAQDLDPSHPGLAGGVYFAAQGLGITAGGALIAVAEGAVGLPHAFLWPAAAILCGGAFTLLTRPRRVITRPAVPSASLAAVGTHAG